MAGGADHSVGATLERSGLLRRDALERVRLVSAKGAAPRQTYVPPPPTMSNVIVEAETRQASIEMTTTAMSLSRPLALSPKRCRSFMMMRNGPSGAGRTKAITVDAISATEGRVGSLGKYDTIDIMAKSRDRKYRMIKEP